MTTDPARRITDVMVGTTASQTAWISTDDKQPYRESSALVAQQSNGGLDEVTVQLIGAGLPTNTRRAYAQDRRDYAAWCQQRGLEPLPARPEQLAAWAAFQLTVGSSMVALPRPRAPSSVSRSLSGVSTWQVEHGLGKPDLRLARLVLRGWQRQHLQAGPRRAAPATPDVLRRLLAVTEQDESGPTVRGVRDRAMILIGFAVAARRSELAALDVASFTPVPEGLVVRVLRAKTKDRVDEVAVPYAQDEQLCPVRALRAHLELLASRGITSGAAFRRVTRTGVVLEHRLRPAYVATLVGTLASRAGVPVPAGFGSWAGHSLRRGCAVSLHAAGADHLTLSRHGGWAASSATVGAYIVEADRFVGHPLRAVL